MSEPTAARTTARKDSHWYTLTGEPRYEIIGKTTGKPRPVTLRDAREGQLVPSVTTILKLLHKQGLVDWMIEQAVLACLTSPRKEGEAMDAFVERVLHVEKVQEQEGLIARDKGTEIHNALEDYFTGIEIPEDIKPWIMPAIEALEKYGDVAATEKILVGEGFAGKTDLIMEAAVNWWVWDYKTTKKLPDPTKGGAWSEHRLQLSAYARAYTDLLNDSAPQNKPVRTANIYISTVDCGKFVICEHPEWETCFAEGFAPLVTHWQWANNYRPGSTLEKVKPAVTVKPPAPEPKPAADPNVVKGRKVSWDAATAPRKF